MKTNREIPEGVKVNQAQRTVVTATKTEYCLMGTDSEIYSPVFDSEEELRIWMGLPEKRTQAEKNAIWDGVKILAVTIIGVAFLTTGCAVKWVGRPAVGTEDSGLSLLPRTEIGLRSDGVVVWRACKPLTNQPPVNANAK